MKCREPTLRVMEARGISTADPGSVPTMRARMDICAAWMRRRGARATKGINSTVLWRVAQSNTLACAVFSF